MNKKFNFYTYDLETYKNCFLFIGKFKDSNKFDIFEISSRKNMRDQLKNHLSYLQNLKADTVGYNNLGFDYPIVHDLINNFHTFDAYRGYAKAQEIIKGGDYGKPFYSLRDRLITQIDLSKINHFDNKARRTSLKVLQFNMRSESVEDLPFDINLDLTNEQMDDLIKYCMHDVSETEKFLDFCLPLIHMRQELLEDGSLKGDVLNYSDVKIGSEYLINKIGFNKCYHSVGKPKQTYRSVIKFKDIILPKIFYRTNQYNDVLEWFMNQEIHLNKEATPKLEVKLADLDFVFGVGGIHASVNSKAFHSNDEYEIIDVDVSGMYPQVAIANGFYPEHLGQDFVTHYKQLAADRKHYPKGSTMNAVLKLAVNGTFGKTNDVYSCFYDPKYTFSVTVNGQLQLLQLVESLYLIPDLKIIQANTDGITAYIPKKYYYLFEFWKKEWENQTKLSLEEVKYKSMWIRDVNNYLALKMDGSTKGKGDYQFPKSWKDYEGNWNKDYSSLIVPMITEQMLINNWNPKDLIRMTFNPFDFMLRYKTPSGSTVYIGDKKCSKTVRYYVSKTGEYMKKKSNPKGVIGQYKRRNGIEDSYYLKILNEIGPNVWDERIHTKNKSKYEELTTSIQNGYRVKECNVASKFDWNDVDYDYYIEQINKLYIG